VRSGFRKRSCSNKKLERDDDSTKRHPALAGVQAPGEDALLRVQAVLGLVEHDRLRPLGDLVAAMGGQAVQEQRIGLGRLREPWPLPEKWIPVFGKDHAPTISCC
jgi:hypothetical protein